MKPGNSLFLCFVCGSLLALTLLVSACWAQESKRLTIISYPARPPKLPLWLGRDAGLFQKYGVAVSINELNTTEELLKELGNRSGDIYAATAPYIVAAIGDGADLV